MTSLDFLARKAAAVRRERADARVDVARLHEAIHALPPAPSFRGQLAAGDRVALIAEYKRRSPSAGELTDEAPADVAEAYARAGARALSVLTDGADFGGSLDDLHACAAAARLPILRKDFVVDEAGVLEARRAGASATLLIAALLPGRELEALARACASVGLDALVEVHDEAELERALGAGARVVGINNRDLRSLRTDLAVTERLARRLPAHAVLVAESGVRTRADVERMRDAGAHAVLVGESLVRARGAERANLAADLASVPRAPHPAGFRVKVCGLTSAVDAALAVACGADAVGVVLWPGSRRAVTAEQARTILHAAGRDVLRVGVFVDAGGDEIARAADAADLGAVQLAGDEPAAFARALRERGLRVIRSVPMADPGAAGRFADYPADLFLLETPRANGHGGSGRAFDWSLASELPWPRARVVLAGGLTPDNVGAALAAVGPAAVDVASGVEAAPGRKDAAKLDRFMNAVRRHDAVPEAGVR